MACVIGCRVLMSEVMGKGRTMAVGVVGLLKQPETFAWETVNNRAAKSSPMVCIRWRGERKRTNAPEQILSYITPQTQHRLKFTTRIDGLHPSLEGRGRGCCCWQVDLMRRHNSACVYLFLKAMAAIRAPIWKEDHEQNTFALELHTPCL